MSLVMCALRNLACEAPRDQGGVGCHVQSICHALSETNAGHRQEDITWSQVSTGAGHGRSAAKFWRDPEIRLWRGSAANTPSGGW